MTYIITEDLTTINSLTGIWGKSYAKLVNLTQKLNLFFLKIIFPKAETINWGHELSQIDLSRERKLSWQITNQIIAPLFKDLSILEIPFIKTWQTYIAIYLSHQLLTYRQASQNFLKKKPKLIILLGFNRQTKISHFLAKKQNIKTITWPALTFSRINRRLLDWLYTRELTLKANKFIQTQSSSKKLKTSQFLLTASFFRHLKTLLPLHQKMVKNKLNSLIVLDAQRTNQRLTQTQQQKSIHLASLLTLVKKNQIYKQSSLLSTSSYQSVKLPNPQNFDQLTVQLIKGYLKAIYLKAYPLSCLYLKSSAELIKKTKPKGVVLVSDVRPLEVCLGLLAQKQKIKSLLVSPNTILSLDEINKYDLTNQLTVVGPHLKKQLTKIGLDPQKIHPVGDLRFENLQKSSPNSLTNFKKTKNFLLISFRANPRIPLSEKKAFFTLSYQAILKIPNSQLIIKPHPTESRLTLQQQVKAWGLKKAIVVNNQDHELIDLLKISHATLITWSMAGFESLLSKTPVIVINPTQKNYDQIIPYVKNKGALLVKTSEDLTKQIKFLSNKANYQKTIQRGLDFVSSYIKIPDGRVADRVIKLLTT